VHCTIFNTIGPKFNSTLLLRPPFANALFWLSPISLLPFPLCSQKQRGGHAKVMRSSNFEEGHTRSINRCRFWAQRKGRRRTVIAVGRGEDQVWTTRKSRALLGKVFLVGSAGVRAHNSGGEQEKLFRVLHYHFSLLSSDL
jgi:hypothetical protein